MTTIASNVKAHYCVLLNRETTFRTTKQIFVSGSKCNQT